VQTSLLIELAAEICPDRIAVGNLKDGLSFASLRNRANAVAHWLLETGAHHAVQLGLNSAAVPLLIFGSGMAGLPFVPINYRLSDEDLSKLIERMAPAVIIVDDDMAERISSIDGVEVVLRSAFHARFVTGPEMSAEDLPETDNDIAILLFTSGTTGEPKAAVLRHANLTSYVISTVELLGADESEAALVSVPPYHIAGISAVLTSIYAGRRIVYLPAFTPDTWVTTAARERITNAMVVPTMLDRILSAMESEGEKLPALRALSYGGGRMPESTITRALSAMPSIDFVNAYGLTETSSTIALLGADDHRAAFMSEDPAIRHRLGSVGKPLPSIELEIRSEEGDVLGPDMPGEIYVRGDQVSGEYLNKTSTLNDGWFATKDSGWLDQDGYLYVQGRLDDVIVRGGENISPGEIEDVLREHAAILDVAVLGLPCEKWGEKVAAVIVCSEASVDLEALSAMVKEKLRSTKTPELWFIRDELPYNETGKLLRRVLKAELLANC
jgi:acyl-CoA synthetase (AMP-forming)/AMP-acid ligase II